MQWLNRGGGRGDLWGKERQGKWDNRAEKKENWKREGGKIENGRSKMREDFFLLLFTFQNH